jgi:hypothetical protein
MIDLTGFDRKTLDEGYWSKEGKPAENAKQSAQG